MSFSDEPANPYGTPADQNTGQQDADSQPVDASEVAANPPPEPPVGEPQPASAEAERPPAAPAGSSTRRPARRTLMLIFGAVVFVTAAYLIVPQFAASALQRSDAINGLRDELNRAVTEKTRLIAQLNKTNKALAEAKQQAEQAAEDVAAKQAKLVQAGQVIEQLTARLNQADGTAGQTAQELVAAKTALAEIQTAGTRAGEQLAAMKTELAGAKEAQRQSSDAQQELQAEKSRLEEELNSTRQAHEHLERLLKMLQLDDGDAPESPGPGEMPITSREMLHRMGQPTVVFHKNRVEDICWGTAHRAVSDVGLITRIDGKPADRKALPGRGGAAAIAPVGKWRFQKGQTLAYADLVEMYGRPEGMTGTGTEFVAWWSVGAWAQRATAKVVNGVVVEFVGKPVDAALCSSLVRQRAEAYSAVTPAVNSRVLMAKAFYDEAAKAIGQKLAEESAVRARDGETLKDWRLAPFDSAGTWIAPTAVFPGGLTLRARVDCTWANSDGKTRPERRYVVLSMTAKDGEVVLNQYVVVAPRT